jgi:hypothetical protein
MTSVKFPAYLLALSLPLALSARAEEPEQSLAERAEKARQKKVEKGPSKVLTNKDLRNAKGTVIVLPEPSPSSSPSPSDKPATPAAAPTATPNPATITRGVAADPAAAQASAEELSDRITRYRKAIQEADTELRAGGALSSERRAALTKFLEDGRKEVAQAEQALAELKARYPGSVVRP